jgi:6,7-dimethyl-8-ribityllumazine synthase
MHALKLAIVVSKFNSEITSKLLQGAVEYHKTQGVQPAVIEVPGAVEIGVACAELLSKGFDGVTVVGAVIRGDTSHYEVVCNSVERAVTHLMLEYRKPIGFGVLTTENEEQALDRAGGKHGNKGSESAAVVFEMLETLRRIKLNEI